MLRGGRASPEDSLATHAIRFPIVVLGASAGGIEALEAFFSAAPFGFGLNLVQRETSYGLAGRADIHFEPNGLNVTITFPVERSGA